jgi:ActR/RegA family two-component response regulator
MNKQSNVLEESKELIAKKIDVVIIEDDKTLADVLAMVLDKHGKKADIYYSGEKFIKNFEQYPLDTKICFNYSLEESINGVDIAKILHKAGYTKLYLFTGWDKDTLEGYGIPDYLTVLFKTDTDKVIKVLTE